MKKYEVSNDPLNVLKANYFSFNKYGYPSILDTNIDIKGLIPFDRTQSKKDQKDTHKTVHFYLNDYKFNCIWNTPNKYINLLKKFNGCIMPDFSNYDDYPEAINIFQMYKRFWVTRYLQDQGINVIPSVRINASTNLDQVIIPEIEPIPKGSTISISSVRVFNSGFNKERFILEIKKILEVIQPRKIIWYGKLLDNIEFNCEVQQFKLSSYEYIEKSKEVILNG